jgi:predicted KAP-like P-loop ATPase
VQQNGSTAIIKELFPKLQLVWDNTSYGSMWEDEWKAKRRVCSKEMFPVYFRHEVPAGQFSRKEMDRIVKSTANAEELSGLLLAQLARKAPGGTTMAKRLLVALEAQAEKGIPVENVPKAIQALLDIGDDLLVPEDSARGIFDFGSEVNIGRVFWRLLKRLSREQRYPILQDAMAKGRALTTICRELRILASIQGEFKPDEETPDEKKPLLAEDLTRLKDLVLGRIREQNTKDALRSVKDLDEILHAWRWLSGKDDEVADWMRSTAREKPGLAWLLEKSAAKTHSQSINDYISEVQLRLNPKLFEPALPRGELIERVRDIARDGARTDGERAAAQQYILEYDMLSEGKDPDAPGAFDRLQ